MGSDSWILEQEVERILTGAVGPERGGDVVETFRGDETTWARVVDAARTGSLFAERRAVVVRTADALKGEGEELVAYLAQPSATTTLVLAATKADKRRQPWKSVYASATVVAAEPLRGQRLKARIAEMVRARGLVLSGDAFEELAERVGQDLRRLSGEIDKLEAFAGGRRGALGADEVAAVLGRGAGLPLYRLSDAMAARRTGETVALLEAVLDDGEPPLKVLGTLHRSLRQVRAASYLQQARTPRPEMLTRLNLNGIMAFKLDGLLQSARRWTDAELARAVKALETADRRVKSGTDPRVALTAAVVEGCGGGAAPPSRGSAAGRTSSPGRASAR